MKARTLYLENFGVALVGSYPTEFCSNYFKPTCILGTRGYSLVHTCALHDADKEILAIGTSKYSVSNEWKKEFALMEIYTGVRRIGRWE